LLAENVSKAASLCLCKEDISRDIKGVPLQSPCVSFVFRVGIKGIKEWNDLQSTIQQMPAEFKIFYQPKNQGQKPNTLTRMPENIPQMKGQNNPDIQ
jgi:hypothetical protein